MSNGPDKTQSEDRLIGERRQKLAALREAGEAYPNHFRPDAFAGDLQERYANHTKAELEATPTRVAIAGRMLAKRVMGKASFARVQDMAGQIQLFVQRDALPDGVYTAFKSWDLGDIVGASGDLYRTDKGELSVRVDSLELLTKSLRPLPDKWHGLSDQETRYRRRYVDLIINAESRQVFERRSAVIRHIRDFLEQRRFLEVETPMMQVTPGGAVARPFVTHHNALDIDLYLRIAPELFLKRLTVGGFDRVYEINRNFRNEGVSTQHNPEFTMLELYQAYANFEDLMDMLEALLRGLAEAITGSTTVVYQGAEIDFGQPFRRLSIADAIVAADLGLDRDRLRDVEHLREVCGKVGVDVKGSYGAGKLQLELFEAKVERELAAPTFMTMYPAEVSPLSRRNDADPFLTDRFELFIAGREIANGFSELNDPDDQAERFRAQVADRDSGDDEAMFFDSDYIRALEYGLPPTAGLGVGIDRLVMLLTDSASIRDVLLFPYMRPESGATTTT
ncbi:MAG: lysine--tRNA ligase [Pseudomonadota bacterium]